ncbi:MAG TPA: aminoglycoside phosphotransferase family protein [Ilumatobacter sp.]|nr:aminoglycoside phosphotransferase family protein [Ilumatobacter sp.]
MNTDRPFVDRPVADRAAAARVAERQAVRWGLGEPRLLRHGMNSLYVADGVVLRVGAATAPAAASHALVHWLLDAGVPTVPPVDGLTADVDGLAVTGWRLVRETRRPIDWRTIGEAVRRVHALELGAAPVAYPIPEPAVFPWWDFDTLLADVAAADVADQLDARALAGLRSVIERHRGWEELVRQDAVLCHGDVHPGNVLMSGAGALLIDWDLMCVAHPAWDHAMLTTYADRWGGDPGAYPAFAEGYGASFADDPLARALGELRNVAATLMRVRAGRHDPTAKAEADHRLAYWRGDTVAPWRAQ